MAMQSYTRDLDEELFLAVADGDIQQVNRTGVMSDQDEREITENTKEASCLVMFKITKRGHLHTFTYIYIRLHTFTSIYIDLHTFTIIYIDLHRFT